MFNIVMRQEIGGKKDMIWSKYNPQICLQEWNVVADPKKVSVIAWRFVDEKNWIGNVSFTL
jgi:hypothetical protein